MSENQCVDGGGLCTMCSSAGRCMKYKSQSVPFGHPHYNRESLHCPETGLHCYDPNCGTELCKRKHHREKEGKKDSDKLFEDLMKRLETASIFERKHDHAAEKLINIIADQVHVINNLTEEHHHRKRQRVEQVLYFIFNNNKYITMALSIASNQSAPIILGLIDSDTRLPVTATFVGETETSDNPAVATTDPTLGLVAVKTNTAGGSGNLTSVATWTYTDKNTNLPVTVQKTTVTPFTVTSVVTAENVEMTVTLGAPVTQP